MNDMLKFITCGSVDDGKSTLIGHMLYDAKLLFADQKQALELDSKVGSNDGDIDYSLLLDGLMAEREQGITIDVAYRYFSTDNRSFIVADTPGHEEYTRNMAVGASFADLAIILVDASKGILVQTRRHARICAMMGIRHFVFALNKMDIVHYSRQTYQDIEKNIKRFMAEFDYDSLTVIPVSATIGDNITSKSDKMPWYKGETLLQYLENIDITASYHSDGFCMPVQRVCRPNRNFRGFQGQISSGTVSVGDEITVSPGGETAKVTSIYEGETGVKSSTRGNAVTISLDTEIDISRGDVISCDYKLYESSMFVANILWMDDVNLFEGKNFWLKTGTQLIPASVLKIKYRIDVNTGEELPADSAVKNELICCEIMASDKIVFDKFDNNRDLGSLILIDRITNMTSACGVIEESIDRRDNLFWQNTDINRQLREKSLGQKAVTFWFTGFSGSGKSTIANIVEKKLFAEGCHTMLLDGDNVRMGLNNNLGFSAGDRLENLRRVAEVAKLMNDAGLVVITAFISPYEESRAKARDTIGDSFIEVFVDTPIEECARRDVKGLYAKAKAGTIDDFTGISNNFEIPVNPEVTVKTLEMTAEECADKIIEFMKNRE